MSQPIKKFSLLTFEQLLDFPEAEWLIDEIIEANSLGVLYGRSGAAKSFTALDMALSIATGRPWQDRHVKQGRIVYVVGEGARGVRRRVVAWQQQHGGVPIEGAFFLMEAPRLLNSEDVLNLQTSIREQVLSCDLIVIDTLATAFVGGDENKQECMTEFVDSCRTLQRAFGAALLLVHHTGKNSDAERGSSVLRGAADVMVFQSMTQDRRVTIRCNKQKDDEAFPDIRLQLVQVKLASNKAGKPATSCVLVRESGPEPGGNVKLIANPEHEGKPAGVTLRILVERGELSSPQLRELTAKALKRDVLSPKTYQNWRQSLVEEGLIEAVPGKPQHYRPTTRGRDSVLGTLEEAA